MTPLQEYVKQNGLEKLTSELGITVYHHPTLPLVGAKYNHIDSPKTHEVVRWARGTVLEKDSWNLVAQPFIRFFNYGENEQEMKSFDWKDVIVTSKEDGSLAIVFFYAGAWHMNTSGSFGLGQYDKYKSMTWQDLFWKTFADNGGDKSKLNPKLTYVFELCTLDNKVVRIYQKASVFLLSLFKGEKELSFAETQTESKWIGVRSCDTYGFRSIDEVKSFLEEQERKDPTFEGVVVRDCKDIRFKIKSASYLNLHHLCDNGNISRTNRLVDLALTCEGDEILAYLPELRPKYEEIKQILEKEYLELKAFWETYQAIESQKDFALKVKDHKFSGILFAMRKKPVEQRTDAEMRKIWINSTELILKKVFN